MPSSQTLVVTHQTPLIAMRTLFQSMTQGVNGQKTVAHVAIYWGFRVMDALKMWRGEGKRQKRRKKIKSRQKKVAEARCLTILA